MPRKIKTTKKTLFISPPERKPNEEPPPTFQHRSNYQITEYGILEIMSNPSIARIAALIGEPGRIQMLTTLLSGNAHSATELALAAQVSPQTASSHLSKL